MTRNPISPFIHAGEGICLAALERFIRWLDLLLKRQLRIYEFCDSDDCILRLSLGHNATATTLTDGTVISVDQPLGELHFWNEHLTSLPAKGSDLHWAIAFHHHLVHSLRQLAAHVASSPHLQEIQAFRGDIFLNDDCKLLMLTSAGKRSGFQMVVQSEPRGLWKGAVDFWESLYAVALLWTFNPASLKGNLLKKPKRVQLWISRKTLLSRYGNPAEKSALPLEEQFSGSTLA